MRQREQPDTRSGSDLRRLSRRRVERLECSVALLLAEGRLVHEDVRAFREHLNRVGRCRVAGEHDPAPGTRLAEHRVGRDHLTVIERDRIAPLQSAALGSRRHAERIGGLHVEPARPIVFVERVPDRAHTVMHGNDEDAVAVPLERLTGAHLDGLDRIRQPADDPPQVAEELAEARRPIDGQRHLPLTEGKGLQHPRQAERVIGVVVRQEDLLEIRQAQRRTHQLALRSFCAVEEQALAAPPHEKRCRRPRGGRGTRRRTQEDDVEVHAAA